MEQAKVEVRSRKELRDWLRKNHKQKESIWLVSYKKNSEYYLPYKEIVEEALCFGWIDSLPRKLDDHRTMHRLSPRNPKSAWSKINRELVKKLEEQKLMTSAGRAVIELAKKSGNWNKIKGADSLRIPSDLAKAFTKSKKANTNFLAFPPSSRRAILEWILQAKKPETRKKRITETVSLAKKNIRANHYRQTSGKEKA